MWEVLVRTPLGTQSRRKFSMLLATFFVACLTYIFAAAPSVSAADAIWTDDTISYENNTYTAVKSKDSLPIEIKGSPFIYEYVDDTKDPKLVYFIYFPTSTTNPKSEGEATYVTYSLGPPTLEQPTGYTNISDRQPITVVPASGEDGGDVTINGTEATSCAVKNVGWLVCGVGGWIADGIDIVYTAVASFLIVQPLTSDNSTGLYNLWDIMRNFANIAFVIGFLVVIYSYLVGGGFNGYEIRKILPRMVVAAILINISFWICAVAVDISNIVGVSLQDLLVSIRENSVATSENKSIGWAEMTAYIFSGGTIGVVGALAATGGSIASFGFMLLGILIVVVFALFVAFVILAARQAVIIMLIVLSPLAFAAFILPNTEKWFDRWRSTFTTLLVLFPIFSLLFGGSQLAGAVIIQNAPDTPAGLAIMLFGMAVQIVPLVITPLLIQFSGSLLGRIAGIVNNPGKGMVDRSRNWTRDRQEYHRQKNLAQPNTPGLTGNKWNVARRGAQRMYAKETARKRRLEGFQKDAETLAHDKEFGDGFISQSRVGRAIGMEERQKKQSYAYADERYRAADIRHNASESHHNRHFANALNTNPAYADLRDLKRKSVVDSGVADIQNAAVDADGQEDFRRTVKESDALRRVVQQTYGAKQQAERFETIVQKAAEESWSEKVRNNNDTQKIYLEAQSSEGSAQRADQELKTFVQNIRAKGSDAPQVTAGAVEYADRIKDLVLETDTVKNAEIAAQSAERINIATAYKASAELRMKAGGIGGEAAANLVYAKAFQTMVNDQVEGTKAEKTILGQVDSDEIFKRMDNPDASVEQLAAYAGTIAGRGFHAHHIKLLGKISGMYQAAVSSGDDDRIAKMKDMVQQAGGDMSKTAFGVRDFDRTLLSEGRYDANIYQTTRERILTNLSPEVMANMDPDDIHLIYEMHRKGYLNDEQSEKIRHEWNEWQNDSVLKSKIQAKHRNFFDRIKNDDYTSEIGGMSAPNKDKYGITEDDFGQIPPDVEIKK